MVMIHTHDDAAVNAAAKDKSKTNATPSKKEVGSNPSSIVPGHVVRPSWSPDFVKERNANGEISFKQTKSSKKNIRDEDVVMVDHGDPLVTSGPEDIAFVDHPTPLSRSNTTPRRSTGFFGSFFGGGKTVEPEPRPRSQTLTDAEDQGLPIRTKDRSKRKSRVVDGEDFTTDGPGETDADVEARRQERKARREARDQAEEVERADREQRRKDRREREKADLEARRRKDRERARQEQEAEDQRREEKRARRAAKEARRQQEELEISQEAERKREERRALRAKLEMEQGDAQRDLKEERRRKYHEEELERSRRKEHRSHDKDRSRGHRSSALVEEYHESRSGSGKGIAPPANKTSSWVNSQADEPPEVPPVEGTIVDGSGEKPRAGIDDDEYRRSSRRRDKYAGMTDAEIDAYRAKRRAERRGEGKSASGGSHERERERDRQDRRERRRRKDRDGVDGHVGYGYEDAPVKTWDGRPSLGRNDSKRRSFLGSFF